MDWYRQRGCTWYGVRCHAIWQEQEKVSDQTDIELQRHVALSIDWPRGVFPLEYISMTCKPHTFSSRDKICTLWLGTRCNVPIRLLRVKGFIAISSNNLSCVHIVHQRQTFTHFYTEMQLNISSFLPSMVTIWSMKLMELTFNKHGIHRGLKPMTKVWSPLSLHKKTLLAFRLIDTFSVKLKWCKWALVCFLGFSLHCSRVLYRKMVCTG